MVETIRTQRLILRPLRPSDAGPIALHAGDLRVARMTASIPHPYPPGTAETYIEGTLAGRRGEEVWAVDATPIGGEELVGVIGFRPASGALGFWIGPPWWRSGFASEALGAVLAHLFEARGVEAVEAHVFADDVASTALLGRLGFREAGRGERFSVARGGLAPCRRFRLAREAWRTRADADTTEAGR